MAKRLPGRDLLSLSAAADAIEAQEQAERDYPRTYFEECKVRTWRSKNVRPRSAHS